MKVASTWLSFTENPKDSLKASTLLINHSWQHDTYANHIPCLPTRCLECLKIFCKDTEDEKSDGQCAIGEKSLYHSMIKLQKKEMNSKLSIKNDGNSHIKQEMEKVTI